MLTWQGISTHPTCTRWKKLTKTTKLDERLIWQQVKNRNSFWNTKYCCHQIFTLNWCNFPTRILSTKCLRCCCHCFFFFLSWPTSNPFVSIWWKDSIQHNDVQANWPYLLHHWVSARNLFGEKQAVRIAPFDSSWQFMTTSERSKRIQSF